MRASQQQGWEGHALALAVYLVCNRSMLTGSHQEPSLDLGGCHILMSHRRPALGEGGADAGGAFVFAVGKDHGLESR